MLFALTRTAAQVSPSVRKGTHAQLRRNLFSSLLNPSSRSLPLQFVPMHTLAQMSSLQMVDPCDAAHIREHKLAGEAHETLPVWLQVGSLLNVTSDATKRNIKAPQRPHHPSSATKGCSKIIFPPLRILTCTWWALLRQLRDQICSLL